MRYRLIMPHRLHHRRAHRLRNPGHAVPPLRFNFGQYARAGDLIHPAEELGGPDDIAVSYGHAGCERLSPFVDGDGVDAAGRQPGDGQGRDTLSVAYRLAAHAPVTRRLPLDGDYLPR